jgi:hypothetical protein
MCLKWPGNEVMASYTPFQIIERNLHGLAKGVHILSSNCGLQGLTYTETVCGELRIIRLVGHPVWLGHQ